VRRTRVWLRVSDLLGAEHLGALVLIAAGTAGLVFVARRRPGAWLRWMAVVLVAVELSWWAYVLSGGVPGSELAYSLPLQLCDAAIFVAAAALWTRRQLIVEVTYFWGLAGTIQALLTPDLPQHFPSYPYFQYYLAHGGVVAAALLLVIGLRIRPRHPFQVAGLTAVYTALVGVVDLLSGANYMYLRAKPPAATLLDVLGPWPVYIVVAPAVAFALLAALYAPFWFSSAASRNALTRPPR
jgi:hypothetical integral membrane protein (TIGR02206 family)